MSHLSGWSSTSDPKYCSTLGFPVALRMRMSTSDPNRSITAAEGGEDLFFSLLPRLPRLLPPLLPEDDISRLFGEVSLASQDLSEISLL